MKKTLPLLLVAALAAVILGTTASAQNSATFKAAMVSDTGNINDKSFNHLSKLGLDKAHRVLGAQTHVFISNSASDYLPNLTAAARQGYQAIVATGFLLGADMDTAATQFPKAKFAIVDFPWSALTHKPKNAVGLTFESQQSGYLVGYLAGLMAKKQGGKQVVSAVGGKKLPSVDNWIAGYFAGAKKANPGVKTLLDYSNEFPVSFAAKCKELALNQIARGSQMIFQVAGGCGLGALDAAKEKSVWGIGVDADQSFLGPHILTSAVKRVDTAVFDAIKLVVDGKFKGGNIVFGLKDNGVGVGKISPRVPKSEVAKVMQIRADIIAGKIKNIPTTVK
jgi:basic membrane protein A and related proteins